MQTKKRILFIAEAVTLAHVARPYVLASALDPESYEIRFACDPRFNTLFDFSNLNFCNIESIPTTQFLDALAKGSPVYNAATLKRYVLDDLVLLDDFKPDIVVGDFRLSLAISARLRNVPYITITNAYWGPYTMQHFPVPDIPITSLFGPTIAQKLFDIARPLAFRLHTRPFNRVCMAFGLPKMSNDLREIYTHANLTLYADLPDMFETRKLPEHHQFIGPIIWSPDVKLPEWWEDIPENKPVIYLTLGSSGKANLLPTILKALGQMPVTVLFAQAGNKDSLRLPQNTFAHDYLPGNLAAAKADLVICNGGSPTTQQALAEGTPVLGVPSNLDQYLNMQAIEAKKAGILLRSDRTTKEALISSIQKILSTPRYAHSAQQLSHTLKKYNALERFPVLLETN